MLFFFGGGGGGGGGVSVGGAVCYQPSLGAGKEFADAQ